MNARKLITTAAAVVALIGSSFAAAPANASDFERRLNLQAMQNYMNQRGGYTNQYYGNVNNIARNNSCRNNWNNNWSNGRNNGWNNGWNNYRNNGWINNGRKWNNGRQNGRNKKWHHRRGHGC
ncbi:MAG: hypothetical protein Q8T09_01330 [Candidatus Melainabacteria bacterium]|nr:hypothetical protein [Candidatus Melainabacteria bacterium]